jgi:histidyl-tRNA synthetase
LLALGEQSVAPPPVCFIAPIGERAIGAGLALARDLRARGLRVDLDGRAASVKAMLRRANAVGARVCVLLGDSELDRNVVKVKDLAERGEEELPRDAAIDTIFRKLTEPAKVPEAPGSPGTTEGPR